LLALLIGGIILYFVMNFAVMPHGLPEVNEGHESSSSVSRNETNDVNSSRHQINKTLNKTPKN